MKIRSETVSDYAAIYEIHRRAFAPQYANEATLVSLLRTRQMFDPALSLVAESDGRVVGHALFSPYNILLKGEAVQAVNLAPIGVLPDYQKRGIGAALIEAGHAIAREKGYVFSFLLGHPDYYPRFGYQKQAFGSWQLTVKRETLPENHLKVAAVDTHMLAALVDLVRVAEDDVDMSILPEASLLTWTTPHPQMLAQTYWRDGALVGYTRGHVKQIQAFYARDDAAALMMAAHCANDAETIQLPLHPQSVGATAFGVEIVGGTWEAAMICPLNEDARLDAYLASDRIGRVLWHSAFDIAG